MITLELLGSTITSSPGLSWMPARISKVLGLRVGAALHHVGAELLVEAAHAGARGDGHDSAAHRGPAQRRRAVVAQARGSLVLLLVHVRDVQPLDRPAAGKDCDGKLGIVDVNVYSKGAGVPHDEDRIADLLQRRHEVPRLEAVTVDYEVGAVAVRLDSCSSPACTSAGA